MIFQESMQAHFCANVNCFIMVTNQSNYEVMFPGSVGTKMKNISTANQSIINLKLSNTGMIKAKLSQREQNFLPFYFILTASFGDEIQLYPGTRSKLDKGVRLTQYQRCVGRLLEVTRHLQTKIILVEGNGKRKTPLDDLGIEVFYTDNNKLLTQNKGSKELQDVIDCMMHFNIQETDFVVKVTARYLVHYNSSFMDILSQPGFDFDAVIKFGSFLNLSDEQNGDCLTGLIGMRANFVKQIRMPTEEQSVEGAWAQASVLIDKARLKVIVGPLGLDICPGSNHYFSV
eukprot:CAMPEP_0173116958 /NCGR_PEP_ID=MMETSP1102-20130122/49805_1 /TAXON_ID=49646 /ORGANISM="Geminigera sp., Strain Caron Lab Isolate" /LENGTH=286 /DNA_ID=CAMNT_0014021083 /DNA_START=307 /DNA_END=1167 /DNA_ORIENTATION=-